MTAISDKKPLAVVFDMDGVIFDSEIRIIECWKAVADQYGMDNVEPVCYQCLGVTKEEAERIFKEHYGQDLPYKERKALVSALFQKRYGEGRLPLKPYVREFLTCLKQNGILIALASSTRREIVVQELTDAYIIDYFDQVICGDMVTRSKPDPEIFLTACRELGVAPGDAIGVEDSYNGVRAASAGGLRTIMIPDLLPANAEMLEKSEAVLGDLGELAGYLGFSGLQKAI